ncbi:MAG: SPOR domain-containing protein [Maribacter sp.]
MKTLACIVIFAFFFSFGHAQNGSINIEQDEKIEELLDQYKEVIGESNYYRIQVGFGTHAAAQKIKSEVEIDFPSLSSKIDFDSPTYRVRVGRFKTKLEGERKLQEVRRKYPAAMLLKPKK